MTCQIPACREAQDADSGFCRRHREEEAKRRALLKKARQDASPIWQWPVLATFEAGPGICRLGVTNDPIRRREDMLPGCPWDIRIGMAIMGPRPCLELLLLDLGRELPLIAPPFGDLRPGWYPLESEEVEDTAFGICAGLGELMARVTHPAKLRGQIRFDRSKSDQARFDRLLDLLKEVGH